MINKHPILYSTSMVKTKFIKYTILIVGGNYYGSSKNRKIYCTMQK